MGIPYYFYHLTKKYKNIIVNELPKNIDNYFIDFNGVIHTECSKLLNDSINSKKFTEELLIEKLWDKINNYNDIYKPKKLIICIDGVAPLAKIIQQRKRRYLTFYKYKIDKIENKWDTNAISPGTDFMNKLNNYLKEHNKNYLISDSNEYGEGEHKIFNFIKDDNENDKIIVINGLDADLIILSLISGVNNIYLMRENNNMNIYVNIDNLKQSLLKELYEIWNIDENNDNNEIDINIIESYCVMCSILGNDFMPHLLNLDIQSGGLDKLIKITGNAIKLYGLLVENNKINRLTLAEIFNNIAETEDKEVIEKVIKEIERKPKDFTSNSQEFAVKNKDSTLNNIYNNNNKWRYYYYKNILDININNDSLLISKACNNYITGIYWTYNYYKKLDLDYTWFYPYNYPPTAKDISNYIKVNTNIITEMKKNNVFLKPEIQLLLILPINSINLINKDLKSYMIDNNKGLKYLYPNEYKIQTLFKNHLWECCPILPMINIDKMIKINNII